MLKWIKGLSRSSVLPSAGPSGSSSKIGTCAKMPMSTECVRPV
jgi:hypothetical protein